jgi:hypothetical protein
MDISVSEDPAVSIFRLEDYSSILKMEAVYVGDDLPGYTASHHRRQ